MHVIKFNGKLEITSKGTAEVDKEQFIEAVKKNIQLFGLHVWYYLSGPDGTMLDLCQDYHAFNLQVIGNYHIRAGELQVENDSSGIETEALKDARFRSYDKYDFYDRGFPRLAVSRL